MSRSKKERRQAAEREQSRRMEAARAACPLTAEQLDTLWHHVARHYAQHGHDNTLAQTNAWLTMINADVPICLDFLADHNIKSDFDVVIRCDPRTLFGAVNDRIHRMPLTCEQLKALLAHLHNTLPTAGCRHDYELSEAWLTANNLTPWPITMAFQALGGFCDCEVLFNVKVDDIFTHS